MLPGHKGLADQRLLVDGHIFQRDLHPHIPPGHHHPVGDPQDLVDVLDPLGVLDLGDDL